MNPNYILRLCATGKHFVKFQQRFYSNRNVLKLHERGMFQDMFPDTSADEINKLLVKAPQCVYAGFDPTAESLHIGNLLVLMNLLHWQRGGHQVIALLGGATGLIGDPSHRISERIELSNLVAKENLESIGANIQTIFENHKKYFWVNEKDELKPPIILNNLDWYQDVNVIEFIRKIGRHFRLGVMMGRTSVQSRLNAEGGMSFTEFTYQIFQAYDWLYLAKTHNCCFQIGGNDQMGNMVSGYDLISKVTKKKVYALTLPLITAEGGKKFGKSVGNAVWLSSKKSSSFQLYQFFVRSKDSDVENYLKLFTFLPLGRIQEIMNAHQKAPEKREAQRILAENVILLVHGEEGLHSAQETSALLYNKSIDTLSTMSTDEVVQVFEGAQVVDMMLRPGITVHELAMETKCFKSDHDALRIIPAGGFHINHQKIINPSEVITNGIHVLPNKLTLIRVGKKNYHIIRWL
ncbi:tyrosine--tRNA ligase, mitochondrial [Venturia canescens]|uniref:tyrosine--tRNA ligase, mitochondrial n=1 Tax=Venturia canescens TaxID=32260 RepID=UPI001C9C49CA|nr:tyrosine--tRNA ligase, mitochondrial [Venturia canescens]